MRWPAFLLLLLTLLQILAIPSRIAAQPADARVMGDVLVLGSVSRGGRSPFVIDPVESLRVTGKWTTPKAGDKVTLADGNERTWEAGKTDAQGVLRRQGLGGGYVLWPLAAKSAQVMILEASGHGVVFINGEPRPGDPYRNGTVRLPILLREGDNTLLFAVAGRPPAELRARLVPPRARAFLDLADQTLPDLVVGQKADTKAAVVVVNASSETLSGLTLMADAGGTPARTPVPPLPPLSVRKVGFAIQAPPAEKPGEQAIAVKLLAGANAEPLDSATLKLRVRRPTDTQKITFESGIDGSIQYYALNPAQPHGEPRSAPALFLTLHGAAVEAIGQADAYRPKSWGHLVAPTNRRPFGFDWEDWGRLDALEVLEHARKRLGTDPRRTYLTGHSMGGHGTWHLGVTFPDRFAAIGPSAGWISMWSYAGAVRPDKTTPLQELLLRAMNPSDTLALARNYGQQGVYILHGGADDNVPASEAQRMKTHLETFHRNFVYHEQRGAGHWWGAEAETGGGCVDWPPMFDLFARHMLPDMESVRQVDFITASPGVSARSHWVAIEGQTQALKPSRVSLRCDPDPRRFTGTTDNVSRLALDLRPLSPGRPLAIHLDGQKLENIAWPEKGRIWIQKQDKAWSVVAQPSANRKGSHRYGPFKEAFRNRVQFVYGTRGTAEENAWALARARLDAETFWYRGNASVEVIPDHAYEASPDRNVILYGNAQTHSLWNRLLGKSSVQVNRGVVRVGDREEKGDDLACLFVQPRPDSPTALIGVVAGTGMAGFRATDRLPVFTSGIAYPDCLVFGAETLTRGVTGVRCAGYFGDDWNVTSGEFAWRP